MNKEIRFKFDWLLWFLILLPTFYIVGKDIRHAQMNFFQISVIFMVAMMLVNRWFGLFLAWSCFQILFFSEAPNKSLLLQNICFAGVLYHFIVKYVGQMKRYFWVFFGLLAVNFFWVILQYFQIDPIFDQANPEILNRFAEYSGFFAIPAFLGNFTAIVLPLCLTLTPASVILAIPMLLVSKSSFSILAAGVGVLFFFWFRKRVVFWALLVICLVGGGLYIVKFDAPGGQFERRLEVWKLVLKQSFRKQFFGHGLGTYNEKYSFMETSPNHKVGMVKNNAEAAVFIMSSAIEMKKDAVVNAMNGKNVNQLDFAEIRGVARHNGMDIELWGQAHNEFLQVFFQMGGVGLFILFGYVFNIVRRFFRVKSKDAELLALMSSFLAILVVSFAHFPFQVARLAGPCLVIMALLETKLLRYEE